jgi:hypothetical protein
VSGSTTNTDILAALNQLVKATNDLCGCRTVATVPINGSIGGDTVPVQDPTVGPGNIPDNYEIVPVPEGSTIDAEACKRANFNYDNLYGLIEQFYDNGVAGLAQLGVLIAVTSITQMAASWGVISGYQTLVAGWSLRAVMYLIYPGVDFSQILLHMTQTKEDIICAWYNVIVNGDDTEVARQELDTILQANGLSSDDAYYLQLVFSIDWALWLIAAPITERPSYEAALDGYVGSVDCSGCGGCACNAVLSHGVDNGDGTYNSVINTVDNRQWASILFSCSDGTRCTKTITTLTTSVNIETTSNNAYRFFDTDGVTIYSSDNPPSLPYADVWRVLLMDSSGDNFVMTVAYE